MNLVKPDAVFEAKLMEWAGQEPEPEFVVLLNSVERMHEAWGREDARRGQNPVSDGALKFIGALCSEENAEMADAMTEHLKKCYMDGYREGGAA